MIAKRSGIPVYLRTLLVLGRTSNLPTVWSNCLAGWLLGGGFHLDRLLDLCLGGTLLYLGGMFLNDAFDAEFDRQHRPERPIPSGAISRDAVWQWGVGFMGLGLLCLFFLGTSTSILALILAACILLYDWVHKMVAFSPVLMAACRFFLYLVAASTGGSGVTGLALWSALVLACYIVGLSYLARKESTNAALRYWPCVFLAAPFVLALIVNDGPNRLRTVLLGIILLLWMLRCLRFVFWTSQRNIGLAVSGLLAGIVLVDWLAVAAASAVVSALFVALFLLALLFQRVVPAT